MDLQGLRRIAFTENDGELVALGEGDIYRINSQTGKVRTRSRDDLWSYDIDATGLAMSPDGKKFAIWRGHRSDSIFDPLLTLLLVWNPHMDVWDIEQNEIINSFGMPKWGFDGCGFTPDCKNLLAIRGGTNFRLCLADGSETSMESPPTPTDLLGKYPFRYTCENHDGSTIIDLVQPLESENYLKYIQLHSFNGKQWNIIMKGGGKGVGVSFSNDEKEIIVVCTETVYILDPEAGKIIEQSKAKWFNGN